MIRKKEFKSGLDQMPRPVVSANEIQPYGYHHSDKKVSLTVNGTPAVLTDDWEALKLIQCFVTARLTEMADKRYSAGRDLKKSLDKLR